MFPFCACNALILLGPIFGLSLHHGRGGPNQLSHLPAEFRRVRWVLLCHCGLQKPSHSGFALLEACEGGGRRQGGAPCAPCLFRFEISQILGEAPALTDMLGGQVQVIFGSVPASIEYIRAGKLRPLAVTTATRFATLPEIPTVSEFVPGYESGYLLGVAAQKHARRNRRQAQSGDQWNPCGRAGPR
jgi:hypothetical protein